MSSNQSTTQEPNLQKVMEEIETKTEKKVETLFLNKSPIYEIKTNPKIGDTLVDIMEQGATEFKEKTGRPMTYSEMRQMFG